jgi:alpha-L-rhamnosidase
MNKIICFLSLCFSITATFAQYKIETLSCEYQHNPSGVDNLHPRLSWKLKLPGHQVTQAAYQVLVADNIADLNANKGTSWDSKKVNSAQSIQVKYAGRKLLSGKIYFWKVKVWDNKHHSYQSAIAKWQMGLLTSTDWDGAKWIAYEKLADTNVYVLPKEGKKDQYNGSNILPMLRKDFEVAKPIQKATLFISGLGHFEASLNGKKIGDHFLDPGWTKYDKEALYVTFNLTSLLKAGTNALGVILGNGFYYIPPVRDRYRKLKVAFGYPKMICRLVIEYKDGTTAQILSDSSWKTAPSPISFSSIYGGEDYDATLEQAGWDLPKFNANKWKAALIVDGPPLNAQKTAPIKIFDHFNPKTISKLANGDWVYDLGQNASGIIELQVKGKKGETIRITPAELLRADGSVNQDPIGNPVYFTYILKGEGLETWRPKFTYHGFRYLQVKGGVPIGKENQQEKPVVHLLNGLHVRNAAPIVGTFTCSNPLFNKTFDLINWAIKSNMMSLFTDCPHREKLGWLEELHLMGSSVRYNYDVAPLFKKSLADMMNSQTPEGLIPEIAPEYVKFESGNNMFRDSPEWGSSSILMPWYLYQWYGDQQVLTTYYDMMKKYIQYLGTKADHHILTQGLGDWYDLGPNPPGVSQLTPMGITATAIYYHDLKILEQIANLIGKNDDAIAYKNLATEVRKAFNDKFYHTETKQYGTGSQAANAMAIYMELVPPADKSAVFANLIKDIRERRNSLTAGDIGYRYVLRVLENEGRSDVIFDMNSSADVPGYGMQLAKGATALTESWAGLSTVSNNHFMLGHIMEWFYSGVGGIRQDEGSIAFNKIKIYPELVGDLTFAKTSYQSPYGLIATNWTKTTGNIVLEVTIPANTTATVYFPVAANQKIISLSGGPYKVIGHENGRSKIRIGSGNYKFKSE